MGRSLRHLLVVAVVTVACFVSMAGSLADGCQFVHMIDPDACGVQVFPVGSRAEFEWFDLRDGGSNRPSAIDFTRVEEFSSNVSFVTQGHYLRVINHHPGEPIGTIDVGALVGLKQLALKGVAAAEAVEIQLADGTRQLQYALYLAGNQSGTPYFIVLDQEAILSGASDEEILIATGELCADNGSCAGTAVDIAVGSSSGNAADQVAFASVLGWGKNGENQQQFLRIDRGSGPEGPFDVTLKPWQRGAAWAGTRARYMGVDVARDGDLAAGVFQTEGETRDLESGALSCFLDGALTDIALWGPRKDLGLPWMQFVTYDQDGDSLLGVSPWKECPSSGGSLSDEALAPGRVTTVRLSSRSATRFWAYTAGLDSSVVGIEYELAKSKIGGTKWELKELDRVELFFSEACDGNGQATQLAIGTADSLYEICPEEPDTCPLHPVPPIPCCLDPQDPDPICDDCVPPPNGFDPDGLDTLH